MRFAFIAGRVAVRMLRTVLSCVVTSPSCVLCGSPAGSISLCTGCRILLDAEAERALIKGKRCSCCGRPLISEKGICTTCREKPFFNETDGVFPLFAYVLSKKKLLYAWKIGKQHNLSEVFARYIADIIRTHYPEAAVVPVPPRPGKIKKTGWDQIEDISLYLENIHGIKVLRLLKRTEGVQQKKLSKEERQTHSRHAYILDEKAFIKNKACLPECVVLLDDVITTGNTIAACSRILKETGAFKKVAATALFIVPG